MNNNLQEKHVVTSFLESGGKILLLRRSEQVGSYRGQWAGVSGYMEADADKQALIEIAEETGLNAEDIELVKRGKPLPVEDKELSTRWVIHPYFFHVNKPEKVRIDWEHKEFRWIDPGDMGDFQTVPALREAFDRVK